MPKLLVAGASGLVGSAAVEHFAAAGGWQIVALSRRAPPRPVAGVDYRGLDLQDPAACNALCAGLSDVTHVVYAAINETTEDLVAAWDDGAHVERNARMLENLLEPLCKAAAGLRHVSLMQGTKAYAAHLQGRALRVPLKETQPRPDTENFYFAQQDYLERRQAGQAWNWTVLRPPIIVGGAGTGGNLNVLLGIAVYASVRKAAGLALDYPGPDTIAGVNDMIDVELLARCFEWAAGAAAARNRVFNIANGDVFTWPDLWPTIAAEMGLPVGEARTLSMNGEIVSRAGTWAGLVAQHHLAAPADVQAFIGASGTLADFAIQVSRPTLVSTIALRQAGFHDCVDTAASIVKWLRRWRERLLLPPRDPAVT